MNHRSFIVTALAIAISACTSGTNNRALGDFEYVKQTEAKPLSIPGSLATPEQADDFKVADKSTVGGPIGDSVDVRAPSLVLPVAASSRVIPETSEAIIWFDKVLEDRDLQAFIYTAVQDLLIENDVAIRSENEDMSQLESDWFHSEDEEGWVFTEITSSESMRFRFDLTQKPHGRSVSLQVTMIDYMKTDERGGTKTADPIDQHRAEMALLNEVVSQVDYKYRLQQRENRLMRASQKIVTVGENPKGEAAYIIEMESDLLWSNLPLFFERHGFDIADLNEDKKIYYVDFTAPDISIWDKIWGDDVPVIEIDEQRYTFDLTDVENDSTALTIYNSEGVAIPQSSLEQIFPVMEPALSFRDL
ncbi:outer membrane protein assembly factor BamC [Thalassotalea euphylliae]|uniref:outer membrane protein assembly factor BamC n=1 Tax=Thalassotalea euphylliae TaxID=1655234 RepID=UPI003628B9A5